MTGVGASHRMEAISFEAPPSLALTRIPNASSPTAPVQRIVSRHEEGGWTSDVTKKRYRTHRQAQAAEKLELKRRYQAGLKERKRLGLPLPNPKKAAIKPPVDDTTPVVGVSNRPAFGYDSYVLGGQGHMKPSSLPGGFEAPDRKERAKLSKREAQRLEAEEKSNVQEARRDRLIPLREKASVKGENSVATETEKVSDELHLTDAAKRELDAVHGLYIPGGQDYDESDVETRVPYEQAMIREARNRGMPTLAICGGSRVLAGAYGGEPQCLSSESSKLHQHHKTQVMAHPLRFPNPSTLLGSALPDGVDKMNSTHEKIVKYDPHTMELNPINKLPQPGRKVGEELPAETEMMISATGPVSHKDGRQQPEGFETRYGAPIAGITSHPEAIYGSRGARDQATTKGKAWADSLFAGFQQSMKTYAAKQRVNDEIRKRVRKTPSTRSGSVVLPESLLKQAARSGPEPDIRFGQPQSRFVDRKYRKGKL